MRRPIATLFATVALTAAACGGGSSPSAPGVASIAPAASPSAPSAAGTTAEIKGFAFVPPAVTAKVGDTITWTNNDTTAHTVTLDDKSVDSANIAPGATFSHAFTAAGTFPYHCSIHTTMKGTITVSG